MRFLLNLRLCLLAFFLLLNVLLVCAKPGPQAGIMDVRNINLNDVRVPLIGEWYFFENQLIVSQNIAATAGSFAKFPQIWNESRLPERGDGYATYALFILIPEGTKSLALEIPQIYSSYSLWANDKLVAVNGKVGRSPELTTPQWMPQTVSFENSNDTLKLVLQIANFNHFKGGSKDPIFLGSSELLQSNRSLAVTSNIIEAIGLGVITLIFLIIFLFVSRKKIILYFAFLCLTWAVRVGFSNLYVAISYWPDFNWTAMVRIEYITLFLTMIWAILFLTRAFPKEENKIFKYLLVGSNCLFISYTLFASPVSFTQWLPLYITFCAILLLYAAYVILRGWINQRTGANYLSVSIFVGLMIFSYDVFTYEGLFSYNPLILGIGYVLMFSLMSMGLLLHLNIIKSKTKSITKLTYKDLYQ
ncbi:MAG: 7TM-DISM domain-containing protein [Cyclobacteriaceae bacterium]|nr:7TM-DISM domain-containing protein [Cyclobacteriaceae bacterium]